MGQEVFSAVSRDPELEVVGAVEREVSQEYLPLPGSSKLIPFSSKLESILDICHPRVVVDFSVAEATMPMVRVATGHGVNLVIGTTGLSSDDLTEIDELSKRNGVGAVAAPNFALGAVLATHLAEMAARFFDWAEIIEMHHEKKVDAPSGTALSTARAMVESRGKPFLHTSMEESDGSRGVEIDGVALHSIRLPGLLAHQEVILGALGQTLKICHSAISRECYMPGVIMAIKEVVKLKGLVYGLDTLLDLKEKY
jgi:4-hydroxy-tetrahydrodipicolinate reductase